MKIGQTIASTKHQPAIAKSLEAYLPQIRRRVLHAKTQRNRFILLAIQAAIEAQINRYKASAQNGSIIKQKP